ncbi:putative sinapine esterase [Arabidopsis thaliana]
MSPSKFHLWKLTCFLITVATEVLGSESFQRYKSIISFGDSISDTGNFLHLSDPNHLPRWPPHHRLHCFENGINFAVAGATAVEPELLQEKGITANYMTNVSLIVQLSIFKKILPNLCGFPSDCREILENSLFIVGEIGGNDYNYGFLIGKSIPEIKKNSPPCYQCYLLNNCELNLASMNNMVQELFNLGARTFLVPGKFPTGCSAAYLTRFRTTDMKDYDALTGCLKWPNEFSQYHNEQLQTELNRLQKLYPIATIRYTDYYDIVLHFYLEPTKYVALSYSVPLTNIYTVLSQLFILPNLLF